MSDRLPPQNLEAEQIVLGGMMSGDAHAAYALEHLADRSFFREAYQRIFAQMRVLHDSGEPVDFATVAESLLRQNLLDACGGLSALSACMDQFLHVSEFQDKVRLLRELAWARDLIPAFEHGLSACYQARGGPETRAHLAQIREMLDSVPTDPNACARVPTRDLLTEMMMNDLSRDQPLDIVGIPTGFPRLDELTRGMRRGEVTLAAALTKIGKSAWAVSLMRHILQRAKVYYLNMEMNRESLTHRLLSQMSGIPFMDLERNVIAGAQRDAYLRAYEALMACQSFEVEFLPDLTVSRARDLLRAAAQDWQPDLVIVDYLQLMRESGKGHRTRADELSEISQGLKTLAAEQDVAMLVLAQINRRAEEASGRPHYYHLNETGAAAMDASVTLILHRDRDEQMESEEPMQPVPAEIIVELNRHGPAGLVPCWFTPGLTFWTEQYDRMGDTA